MCQGWRKNQCTRAMAGECLYVTQLHGQTMNEAGAADRDSSYKEWPQFFNQTVSVRSISRIRKILLQIVVKKGKRANINNGQFI